MLPKPGFIGNRNGKLFHHIVSSLTTRIHQEGWNVWTLYPQGESFAGILAIFYALALHRFLLNENGFDSKNNRTQKCIKAIAESIAEFYFCNKMLYTILYSETFSPMQ